MKLFDYTNINIITKNALSPRSYFLPYKTIDDIISNKPSKIDLNGKWDFSYYHSILDVNDNLKDIVFKDKIDVPSCWQYQGYEKPFYVNNDYQFPFNPPMLPISTPVGVYHKNLEIKKLDEVYILTLLGSSASSIFINDSYVGYFEGTHNMHEFDITSYLKDGTNDIYLLTYKWSNGSYLETQDMYRDNGIFRDIYITLNPKTYIFDYEIKTKKIVNNKYELSLKVKLQNENKDNKIRVILKDQNNNLVLDNKFNDSFNEELEVIEWNAEKPYLYELNLILEENEKVVECIKDYVGFKTIDINNGIFIINNKPIKIKGVNYHESTPENGFYVPDETFLKDIKIIKSLNCNAIRFSHYPTSPYMLELCEKYGLYVINEADIETYGCLATSNKDFVSSDKMFERHFVDRVKHLYERDKNSCAIIMLSIGNESGIGNNLDKAYEYLHSVSNIPVQYETCFRGEYDEVFKDKRRGYDIISIMYPSIEVLEWYNKQNDDRPYYMCEYMHSMGLGPGEMQDVWEYIYKTPRLIGGCIWEYVDHANILEDNSDITKRKYLYGGDNGEYIHDSNFCADGIVLPDRRLSTSALEMKNIYRPFIFKKKDNIITIKNTYSFNDSKNYDFLVSKYKNGILIAQEKINILVLTNEEKEFMMLDLNLDSEYSYVIETISDNEVVGVDNFVFGIYPKYEPKSAISPNENKINGNEYQIVFDDRLRTISSFKVGGKEILTDVPFNSGYGDFDKNKKGFIPSIFRAPIDNDRYVKDEWLNNLYDKMWISFYECEDLENGFYQKGIFSPGKYEAMFDIASNYEFYDDSIKVAFKIKANRDFNHLPRFGVRLQINKEFSNVTYYGYGPNENYPDFNSSCYLKIFNDNASKMNEYYIKPQENGNRMNNRFIRLLNDESLGFEIISSDLPFAFTIHDYALEDLEVAKHDFEIKRRDFYELSINGFLRGVGSQSCGPALNEKYDLNLKKGEELAFSFYIKPIVNKYENN